MVEVLAPTRIDISEEFVRGFNGMTENPISQEELERARDDLIASIAGRMPDDHRKFLLSFKRGEPAWQLLDVPGAENLPAVQWKLLNLGRLAAPKREALITRLAQVLQTLA